MPASDLSRQIGQKITKRRVKLKLTQKSLSDKAQVSPSVICEIEAGAKHPRIDTMVSIAGALGSTLKQLTGY